MDTPEVGIRINSIDTPTFSFRRPKTETYRNLLLVLSRCYDQSEVSLATPNLLQNLTKLKNCGDEHTRASEEENVPQPSQFVDGDSLRPSNHVPLEARSIDVDTDRGIIETMANGTETEKNKDVSIAKDMNSGDDVEKTGLRDEGIDETRLNVAEAENAMQVENDDLMVSDDIEMTGSLDGVINKQHTLMNELELLMNGADDLVLEDCVNVLDFSFEESGISADVEQQQIRRENDMEKQTNTDDVQFDKEQRRRENSEPCNLYLDKHRDGATPNLSDMQTKEIELEKSPNATIDGEGIEEGEISGDFMIENDLMDTLFDDVEQLEKINKKHEVQIPSNQKEGAHEVNLEYRPFTSNLDCSRELEPEGRPEKRKRGAVSKEKKKKRKQKKRAEKNRQLGVRRLRLTPVLKPKPIIYCRHYLHGRCHEGDKCKYSHDTIPLTKSKPCTHFARNACMKGEDCPFDHQLSKYPCTNYAANGFCGRGDSCMFSHKILVENNASPLDASKPEITQPKKHLDATNPSNVLSVKTMDQRVSKSLLKPLTSAGKSLIPLNKSIDGSSSSKVYNSHRMGNQTSQNVPEKVDNASVIPSLTSFLTPKGLNLLSFGKNASTEDFSSRKGASIQSPSEGSLSSKVYNSHKMGNQTSENVAETVDNASVIPSKTLFLPPKGINILSFGKKASSEDFSSRKAASIQSPINNYTLQHMQATPSSGTGNPFKLGNQTTHTVPGSDHNPLQMLKKTSPVTDPKCIGGLSFGRDSIGGQHMQAIPSSSTGNSLKLGNETTYTLPSSDRNPVQMLNKTSPVTDPKCIGGLSFGRDSIGSSGSDKNQSMRALLQKLPTSLLNSGQSLSQPGSSKKMGTNSAQKALMSALTFAAKFESGNK